MGILEIALVLLVSIWTLIFIIIAVFLVIMARSTKQALDKVNHMLDTADGVVDNVAETTKYATSKMNVIMLKAGFLSLKKLIDAAGFLKKSK